MNPGHGRHAYRRGDRVDLPRARLTCHPAAPAAPRSSNHTAPSGGGGARPIVQFSLRSSVLFRFISLIRTHKPSVEDRQRDVGTLAMTDHHDFDGRIA